MSRNKRKNSNMPPTHIYLIFCWNFYQTLGLPFKTYHLASTKLTYVSSNEYTLILAVNSARSYFLNLKIQSEIISDVLSNDFHLIVYGNDTVKNDYDFKFLVGSSNGTAATGYLSGNYFYGTFNVGATTYHVDQVSNYKDELGEIPDNLNAIVYRRVIEDDARQFHEDAFFSRSKRQSRSDELREQFKEVIGNGKVCSLAIVLDPSFICISNDGDVSKSVQRAIKTVEAANVIFRTTDFAEDNIPSNIGLKITKIIVILTYNSDFNILPARASKATANEYLSLFGYYAFLQEVCVGVVYTSHPFGKGILGLSYLGEPTPEKFDVRLGGICERKSFVVNNRVANAAMVTTRGKWRMDESIFDLVVTHELGHSFGAPHDTAKKCREYIMEASASTATKKTHFQFSPCSKKIIRETVLSKGTCLEDETGAFCGNGIVEHGEQCDCGTKQQCTEKDNCCHSWDSPAGKKCKVKKKCHPAQGMCCNDLCAYRNLTHMGLHCEKSLNSCPCRRSQCSCGIEGECLGIECHSLECTRLNLRECSCLPEGSCQICCEYEDACIPSIMATEILSKSNSRLIEKLQQINTRRKDHLGKTSKSFCAGEVCVELDFEQTQSGEYCLKNGKLGTCTTTLECYVPIFNVVPNFTVRIGVFLHNYIILLLVVCFLITR